MGFRPTIDDYIKYGYEPNPDGCYEEWCVWLKTNISDLNSDLIKEIIDDTAPSVAPTDDDAGLMGEVVSLCRKELEMRSSEQKK